MFIKLCDCKIAEFYFIDHIIGLNKCRMLELGFIRNKKIIIISKLSEHGPFLISLDRDLFSLQYEESKNIFLRKK